MLSALMTSSFNLFQQNTPRPLFSQQTLLMAEFQQLMQQLVTLFVTPLFDKLKRLPW